MTELLNEDITGEIVEYLSSIDDTDYISSIYTEITGKELTDQDSAVTEMSEVLYEGNIPDNIMIDLYKRLLGKDVSLISF